MKHTLEGTRAFPIIAWIIVIGFVALTIGLVISLKKELAQLSTGKDYMEERLDTLERKNTGQETTQEVRGNDS